MSTCADAFEIQQLVYRYCQSLDQNQPGEFVSLFTADGTFTAGSSGTAESEQELRDIVATIADRWEFVVHLAANPVIDVNGDTATGDWYYLLCFKPPEEPVHLGFGTYTGAFKRTDKGWRIATFVADRDQTVTLD